MSDDVKVTGSSALPRALPVVCQLLRTKHAFGSFGPEVPAWQHGRSSTAVFWCLSTMDQAGPDDGFAHAERCRPGRACFVQSV